MCECFTKAEGYVCAIPRFDVKDVKSRGSSSGTIIEYKTTVRMCVCVHVLVFLMLIPQYIYIQMKPVFSYV